MAKGSWNALDTSSEVIPASEYRDKITVQLHSGDVTALGFGESAVYGEGILLMVAGDSVELAGALSRCAIHAVCNVGKVSSGGYQTD